MATNPMQRKSRQSFLLGVLITLIIAAVVIYLFWKENQKLQEELNSAAQQKVQVYVLNQDVKSGQTLTSDMFTLQSVTKNAVPLDATSNISSTLSAYSLCDKQGNLVRTGVNENGEPIMYVEINGQKSPVSEDQVTEQALIAKVAIKANTVITESMIVASGEVQTDDVREQTYNMISLPIDLETGDYVDIRLMLPNGLDYIVLSKMKATIPEVGGVPLTDTIKLTLSEGNLLTLSSAIVEAYQIEGSKIYAIKYTDAGNQNAASETYVPNTEVRKQIESNPNIVAEAKKELKDRWTTEVRENINAIDRDEDAAKTGIQESMQSTQEDREEYLSSLYTY